MRENARSDDYKHLKQVDDLRREKEAVIKATERMVAIWTTQEENIKSHGERVDHVLENMDTTSQKNKDVTLAIKSVINDTSEFQISKEEWRIEYEILQRE